MPSIQVDQPDALFDQPIDIVAEGFPPGRVIEISATRLWPPNRVWLRAWGHFCADGLGAVHLATSAPLTGSYADACAMGLFWSMEEVIDKPAELPDVTEPVEIRLDAKCLEGKQKAATTIRRHFTGPGVTARWIGEAGIAGRLFLPPGKGPRPAMITLTGSGGGIDPHTPALYASHGFATLALAYFGMESLPPTLDAIPLEYFGEAITWLESRPEVQQGFLGVSGISRGGELALLLGSIYPQIRAVVGFVPSGVVHGGLTSDGPAWTLGGEPLTWLQQDNKCTDEASIDWENPPIATTPHFESSLRDPRAVARAMIAVERIQGPVLLVSGTDDQMWPSTAMANLAMNRLAEHKHPYRHEHLVFEGAGHQIGPPFLPTQRRHSVHGVLKHDFAYGGSAAADAKASMEAWPKVIAFLKNSPSRPCATASRSATG